jgi:hypothetical protein
VQRLVVQRSGGYPASFFSFPAKVSVASLRARQVATAVCALPIVPTGETFRCPADHGISYSLHFIDAYNEAVPIEADATGCQRIRGQRLATRALSPGFWHDLGAAMGLHRPSYQTFIGKVAQG